MREILFRGKRIKDGEWVYGYYVKTIEENDDCSLFEKGWIFDDEGWRMYEVIPETVGQYTGLKDKNGKKIFEGDILAGNIANLVVAYEGATFIAYWFGHDYDYGKEKMWCNLVEGGKVIGDVHDNPELVGGLNEKTNKTV